MTLEAVFREEHGRILATLVRQLGDLDLAEEATSEAVAAALVAWPRDGVPSRPGAWLLTVARRKAVDRLRRDAVLATKVAELAVDRVVAPTDDLPDDRLRLFFTCAHPALAVEAQVALTLRFLAGLTTPEVARAFLVPVPTMQQRISRAKAKIRDARVSFTVPTDLAPRLPGVLHVVYLVFTAGWAAAEGPDLLRVDLVDEAVRLARVLHQLLPDEPEVTGLLALLLLTDARRAARTSGALVLLEDQDPATFDRDLVEEGLLLAAAALRAPTTSAGCPYALQAAVAALHCAPDGTDWAAVVRLYDRMPPTPVVALNHAAAVAMRDGPAAGLALLAGLDLPGYHLLPAARADLLRRLGRPQEALAAYREARALATNGAEQAFLDQRIAEAGSRPPGV